MLKSQGFQHDKGTGAAYPNFTARLFTQKCETFQRNLLSILKSQTKAYYFEDAEAAGVINDWIGDIPVVVWAADDNFHAYVRQIGDRILTFRAQGETLIDDETGSIWDVGQGRAVEGPLEDEVLQSVPSSTAYDWAWQDFYPESEFYTP